MKKDIKNHNKPQKYKAFAAIIPQLSHKMSGEDKSSFTFNHDSLQQVYDRVAGNPNKRAYPQILPQLYYAINDIISYNNENENINDDVDMTGENSHNSNHNIPIVSYDEEESGAPIIHTGTKNLESLTAPIRYRIKTAKFYFEDELVKPERGNSKPMRSLKNNAILEENEEEDEIEKSRSAKKEISGSDQLDEDEMDIEDDKAVKNQLPLHVLLKTDVADWDEKIQNLEEELALKKEKLRAVKERIAEILT